MLDKPLVEGREGALGKASVADKRGTAPERAHHGKHEAKRGARLAAVKRCVAVWGGEVVGGGRAGDRSHAKTDPRSRHTRPERLETGDGRVDIRGG